MASITIKLGSTERSKTFKKKETLINFLQNERQYWNEFFTERQPADNALKQSSNYIKSNLITKFDNVISTCSGLSDDLSNSEAIKPQIDEMYIEKQIIYSDSTFSKWVKSLEDTVLSMYVIGSYFKGGYTNVLFAANGAVPNIIRPKTTQILSLMNEAVVKMNMFEGGYESNITSEKEALSEIKDEWDGLLTKAKKDLGSNNEKYKLLKNKMATCRENSKKSFNKHIRHFQRFIKTSKGEMKDFEKFYEKELALKSAVTYWRNKKRTSYALSLVLGISLVVIGYSVIQYLLEISTQIGNGILNVDTYNSVNATAGASVGSGKDVVDQAIKPGVETFKKLGYLPILHFAVISTFAVWGIKILVKIFLSKLHVADNAAEREMFIKSYLALLNEHKDSIVDEKDRQLILQSIFRPSNDGLINDDGPKITDVLNTINRKK